MIVAIVGALALLGPFNLAGSRLPDGLYGAFAAHWQAGQPVDCRLCPDMLFVVVCDADRQVHLRSLQQLAALRAQQRQSGNSEEAQSHSCIDGRGFRLAKSSGGYGAAYDQDDPGFRFDLSFRVSRESGAAQEVEVRFHDSRPDIDEAFFRYEATDEGVKPLESWVVTRGHRQLAIAGLICTMALVLLAWMLYFAIAMLRRWLGERRQHDPTA